MSIVFNLLGSFLAPRRIVAAVVGLMLSFPLSAALAGNDLYTEAHSTASSPETLSQSSCEYVVQPGDSVYRIAAAHGMQPWELQALNQDRYPAIWDRLNVGWVLDVCSADQPSAQSPAVNQEAGVTLTVITLDYAKLRTGPDRSYAEITTISYSVTLTAYGRNESGSWIYVDYNGTRGWIYSALLEIHGDTFTLPVTDAAGAPAGGGAAPAPTQVPPPSSPSGPVTITTTSTMRIRSCPSTNCAELGRLPYGVTLSPIARSADNQWVFITYNGIRGYVAAWLITVQGDLASLPVTSEVGSGTAPAANPTPTAPTLPPGTTGFQLGGQTHSFSHPGEMHYAGMTWVKFQHKWFPGENPNDLAWQVEAAHANGFRVLFSIPGPEYPTSIDFNAYVEFVRGVAALGADGIEIWNEMNLDREWPAGQISPSSYVYNMLRPAYNAIKSANPSTLVISGALAPTGVDNGWSVWSDQRYLAGMRDAGAGPYMDCLGVHHNAGATSPDAVSGHPADGGAGHYSWYFQPTFNVYANAFPAEKLCFTEIGYVSGEGYGPMPPNFWWGYDNTVGEQADWLARAAQLSRASNRVRLFIVYNVDFTTWTDDPQAGYAIIRPDGGCPACSTLHNLMGGS